MPRFGVELHSTAPAAVEAVRATLSMLPGNGVLVEDEGCWFVEAPAGFGFDFLQFALARQGYVKRVVEDRP